MTPKDTSAPAFPQHGITGTGLTKREYFAAMAMQGLLACDAVLLRNGAETFSFIKTISIQSFKMADAMLEEGGK